MCKTLESDMTAKDIAAKTIVLKIKTSDFEIFTRSKSLDFYFFSADIMAKVPSYYII